uniref:Uncharacterized protein n=1 Tax=viral metagenome TaxID=1070528 RepID=A0A6C0EZB8_9ZZZZ
MGGYFSSIKVDDAASAINATNDAEHDDVLVLSEPKVDPLEIKNDESGLVVLDDDDKDKEKGKEKEKCDDFASRTTVNDVVYTKKNIKKKNKNKKKGKLLHLS